MTPTRTLTPTIPSQRTPTTLPRDVTEGTDAVRGILVGVMLGLPMWAGIVGGVVWVVS